MPPSTRTSTTAGETADDAAGTTGAESGSTATTIKAKSASSGEVNSIKYTGGTVVERVIQAKHVKEVDESYEGGDIVFNAANKHTVSTEGLSDEVVALLLAQPKMRKSSVEV